MWLDPSGLAPEKEKGEEKLLMVEIDMHEIAWNAYNDLLMINSQAAGFSEDMKNWQSFWNGLVDALGFEGAMNAYFFSDARTGGDGGATNGVSGNTNESNVVSNSNSDGGTSTSSSKKMMIKMTIKRIT